MLVSARGFGPPTPSTPRTCSTRLSYALSIWRKAAETIRNRRRRSIRIQIGARPTGELTFHVVEPKVGTEPTTYRLRSDRSTS